MRRTRLVATPYGVAFRGTSTADAGPWNTAASLFAFALGGDQGSGLG
jgi:hypothetical protein